MTDSDLPALALAAVAATLPDQPAHPAWTPALLAPCVEELRARPVKPDRRLVAVANALGLDDAELLAVSLCVAVERDPHAARAVAEAQAPIGASRPLLGFVATALAGLGASVIGLGCGTAVSSGLLRLGDEAAALPERSLGVPLPILAELTGRTAPLEGAHPLQPRPIPLPADILAEAEARACLMADRAHAGLVLRSGNVHDAVAVAARVADTLGLGLARIDGEVPSSLAPWLIAGGRMPLFQPALGPGQRWSLPNLPAYDGPWIAVLGLDGSVEADQTPDEWTLPVPTLVQRAQLWQAAGVLPCIARRAAASFRQGAGRIAEVAGRARLAAARRADDTPSWTDVTDAMSQGAGSLDALARRSRTAVGDEALVLPPALREALDRLLDRARVRSILADGLGPAVESRYRPGVRALLVGESGTGKTLAAHWLATKLGLPLYRVDLAALTSKFIGETEKNLSAILGAAEHADVLLFFDEADALFGARTDVGDAHDRYANAQTNYLLQRIEEFDGIALLASNSRDRFDPAFTRRLDAILEFPMPEGPARRDLWLAHLGRRHDLTDADLDRLAVTVDLAGGHIRNIVLAAAARATVEERVIAWADLVPATHDEYRKLGRPVPELGS
ncbi:MAG: ATP-binding protein [Acetobacteraceae bacterium]